MTICYCTKAECAALAARLAVVESRLASLEARFNTHTKQPIPEAHKYTPPELPNLDDYCTARECARIRQIAIEAKQKAIEIDLDLQGHKREDIPKAHKYRPKVSVDVSGSSSGNTIKVFTRVDVDGSSDNGSVTLKLSPNLSVEFSLAASSNGTIKGFSKVCLWGVCASASSSVKLPVFSTPSLPPIQLPPVSLPPINIPKVDLPRINIPITPTLPRIGVGGGSTSEQRVTCNLTGSFNSSSCTLTLTLTVNSCNRTINIKMNCKDYTAILNRIESKLGSPLPIYRGSYRNPQEEGEWYRYARDITSNPSSIGSALGILSSQIEDVHKDVVKGIESKAILSELPLPKICQVNEETGEREIVEATVQQMGFGAVIPWLNREVVAPYLIEKLLDYWFNYNEKSLESTQEALCDLDNSCSILMPDPLTPLNTRGAYLLFTWVLEENPKPNVYQTTSQLRNPIDDLKTLSDTPKEQWNTYFNGIYKIIGNQYGTYWSQESDKEPLVKGWFLDEEEAIRFFESMQAITKDTKLEKNNPRFPKVFNQESRIKNSGKKMILRKVCYGTYRTGTNDEKEFLAIHSWKNPYI